MRLYFCAYMLHVWASAQVTGRRYQLRRHCATCLQAPIVGDTRYGLRGEYDSLTDITSSGNGLFLASCELWFPHPIAGHELHFVIEKPAKFAALIEREQKSLKLEAVAET